MITGFGTSQVCLLALVRKTRISLADIGTEQVSDILGRSAVLPWTSEPLSTHINSQPRIVHILLDLFASALTTPFLHDDPEEWYSLRAETCAPGRG